MPRPVPGNPADGDPSCYRHAAFENQDRHLTRALTLPSPTRPCTLRYYEDLTVNDVEHIIKTLREGGTPKPGPYNGRVAAEPIGGFTSLLTEPTGPGYGVRADL